ncbi:hypothetical protein HDU98_010380 [Podochytrium sp. JEL0797]|nr:hypothetical protein HDU98_010380 [Podochytrium sp. JEL0797]
MSKRHTLPANPRLASASSSSSSAPTSSSAATATVSYSSLRSGNSSLPPRPRAQFSSPSFSSSSSPPPHGQHNKRKRGASNSGDGMSAPKRSFVLTYAALVHTLRSALHDDALRNAPFDKMDEAQKTKTLAAIAKHKDKPSNASLIPLLPRVNDNGVLLSYAKKLVQEHLGDPKPFYNTRHHSHGFTGFLAFFPTAFTLNKPSQHPLPLHPSLPATTPPFRDHDRLAFTDPSNTNPLLDVKRIYDEYEASGFNPPLVIERDLPFPLVECNLPPRFEIVYATTPAACDKFVLSELVESVNPDGTWTPKQNLILGFDTETTQLMWTPTDHSHPPNLLQISTHSKCLLVHQRAVQSPLPKSIEWILTHPDIKKVCASAAQEVVDLRKFGGIEAKSVLDIADMQQAFAGASRDGAGASPKSTTTTTVLASSSTMPPASPTSTPAPQSDKKVEKGLSSLAALFLGLKMRKPRAVQVGDWTKPLNARQMDYASIDAWSSLLVFEVLAGVVQQEDAWWDSCAGRRVAVVEGVHGKEWVGKLVEAGFEKVEGGLGGVTVFVEQVPGTVKEEVLKEFYECI